MKVFAAAVAGSFLGYLWRELEDDRLHATDSCDICMENVGWFPRGTVHKICAFRAHLDRRPLPKNWARW